MTEKSIYKSAAGQAEIVTLYNQVLTQWPLPATHLHIPTRYGDTFVIASGNTTGPPLVLLHGSGSNSAAWMGDVAEYGKQFHVYAVDIPGEPGNSTVERFSWDGPAFNEWLGDVLDGLELERVILGGMSLGGWAVINFAIERPERVAQAILIVPSGVHPPRTAAMIRIIFYALLGEWGQERMKRYLFKGMEFSEELDRFLTLVGRHFNYRMGSPPIFTDEQLQRLTMPVVFLAGKHDVLLDTPKTAARLQQWLPNLTVKIYEDEGHATINKAAEVVAALEETAMMQN